MELDVSRVVLSVVIMAGVTYLLRMLPGNDFRKKIENRFVRSFWLMCHTRYWRL